MDEILKRINLLMEKEGIPPSELADKIGIGRPLLSHVLSGRNKPSLQLVLKILTHFPKYSANWLISGEENNTTSQPVEHKSTQPEQQTMAFQPIPTDENQRQPAAPATFTSDAELVLVMYKDKTYDSYKPRK